MTSPYVRFLVSLATRFMTCPQAQTLQLTHLRWQEVCRQNPASRSNAFSSRISATFASTGSRLFITVRVMRSRDSTVGEPRWKSKASRSRQQCDFSATERDPSLDRVDRVLVLYFAKFFGVRFGSITIQMPRALWTTRKIEIPNSLRDELSGSHSTLFRVALHAANLTNTVGSADSRVL